MITDASILEEELKKPASFARAHLCMDLGLASATRCDEISQHPLLTVDLIRDLT